MSSGNSTTWLRAVAIATGVGMVVTTAPLNAQATNSPPPGATPNAADAQQQQPMPLLPAGVAAMQKVPKEDMEKALAAATEAATRDHGWSDMIGTLVAEDRRTLGKQIHEGYTDLYNLADEF